LSKKEGEGEKSFNNFPGMLHILPHMEIAIGRKGKEEEKIHMGTWKIVSVDNFWTVSL
jgi:hypothetical protein